MNWYYVEAGQQAGPVDEAQLGELVRRGQVQPETLVWREGMANWEPYQAARPGAAGVAPPVIGLALEPGQAVCSECKAIFNVQDMIRYENLYVCAVCKPLFMQKLTEGAQLQRPVFNSAELNPAGLSYAGFWIRVGAKLLDGLILGVPMVIIVMVVMFAVMGPALASSGAGTASGPPVAVFVALGLVALAYNAISALYHIVLVAKYGATWGKKICGLRVVTATGEPVSYPRATGRYFAEMGILMVGNMFCYILGYSDYLAVVFDQQKRALHDHICNTRVVLNS
jgi:uncharacterized RDD family membrane protein YckC